MATERHVQRNASLVILFLAAIMAGNFIGTHYLGSSPASIAENNSVAAVLASKSKILELGSRTKESDCKTNGSLPDPACTPGAVFPNMTPAEICISGYTKTVRNVSASLKKKIYAEYDLTYPQPTGSYEADHLIPLELGGSNDIANLFPEAANPTPGFHEKDLVENFLHQEVCSGNLNLIEAQEQIASDWLTVWNALAPEQIKYLKSQF
jgi:hypothetical protein